MLEPALDISVKSDPVWWAEQLGGTLLAGGSIRLNNHKGRIEDLDGFNAGHWWVQDVAASLPVKLLGGIDGKKIADLCAAPGGKTAQLLCAGAEVCAVDASAPRVQRMKENLHRLGLQTEIVTKDIMQWSPAKTFDVVLLDAPCSATGTIRRHPDLAHIKDSSDIVEMAAKQARLLDRAVNLLGWGGILLYCTCSLEPEEAERQIENFIKHTPSVNLLPFTDASSATATDINRDWITPEGYLRTMPCHEMDGFFAARMEVTNGL
jgi:16S rRNA (cytosine967-C5)-methyltransferase